MVLVKELNTTSAGALAIWFLDQCTESQSHKWPKLLLKVEDLQSTEKVQQILARFELTGKLKKYKGKVHIGFRGKQGVDAAKFLNLIDPYVPQCMRWILENFNIGWHHSKWVQQTIQERKIIQHLLNVHRQLHVKERLETEVPVMIRAGVPAEQIARLLRVPIYEVSRFLGSLPRYPINPDWVPLYINEVRKLHGLSK